MQNTIKRISGRAAHQLRPLKISYDTFGYADASVFLELGNTKVLCSITLQQGVPPFLKGKKVGWLTAEYAMLPSATTVRTQRESTSHQKNGRSVEISRLIGRCLRSTVNLEALGERTIVVDCDVLQADGSTRTVCITGASLALKRAVEYWLSARIISHNIFVESIAAVSVGLTQNQALLDLDFAEDSVIDADFNFVITRSGTIIEMQGTAEKKPVSWQDFAAIGTLAQHGIDQLFEQIDNAESAHNPSRAQHGMQQSTL
jgi:ribonuclease PH